ncbi:hypothetical protein BDR26DRAFT_865303 [Obelidium mucronatum]|nr:hypothetical protein BDR26DRAFT_865303 [Obelidium mucronatum]
MSYRGGQRQKRGTNSNNSSGSFRQSASDSWRSKEQNTLPVSTKFTANRVQRNPPPATDEFSNLTLVSRNWDTSDAGLRNRETQVAFFAHILEKLEDCRESEKLDDGSDKVGTSTSTSIPTTTATKKDARREMDSILSKLRKLREGVLSLGQIDAFAIQVYEKSVHVCLEAENYAELIKSLNQLVSVFYPTVVVVDSGESGKTVGQHRGEMTALLLLYMICYIPSAGGKRITDPVFETRQVMKVVASLPDDVQQDRHVVNVLKMQRALLDNVNYFMFRRAWNELNKWERIIAKHIVPFVEFRAMEILTKTYFTIPQTMLERYSMFSIGLLDAEQEMTIRLKQRFGSEYNQRVVNGIVHLRVPKRK